MIKRSSRLLTLSLGFLALSVLYGNCAQNMDTVTTSRPSAQDLLCDVNGNQKVMQASAVSDSDISIQLTPADGDWADTGSDDMREDQIYHDVLATEQAHQIVYNDIDSDFEPVVVAVIDSGVDFNHPDLANQILRRNGQVVGYDFNDGDNQPMDFGGHGTHVAGLIAAEGHNGEGIRGGAPEHVEIMPISVFNPAGGFVGGAANTLGQAVQFAVDNGADVINMSLGATVNLQRTDGDAVFGGLRAVLQNAVNNGIVVVVAAGNDNLELNDNVMTYPAKYGSEIDGVITVGAYDATVRSISPFSNFSPQYVEVQAPGSMESGQGLVSTHLNNSYEFLAGTSMATPLVSGMVALAKVYLKKNGINLTPAQIEKLVKDSSLRYQSLSSLAQEGRVINYRAMIDHLRRVYESGIIQHPRDIALSYGQTGRLAVQMNEFTSHLKFQWYRDGQILPEADDIELVIRKFSVDDIGRYHVVVELESGEKVESLPAMVSLFVDDGCP